MLYFRELRNSCFKVNLPFDSGQAFIDVRFIFFSSKREELDNIIKMNKSLNR